MATKKKARKGPKKANKTTRKKATPKKSVKRSKKVAKKKPAPKRAAKKKVSAKKKTRKKSASSVTQELTLGGWGARSGEQSGDLQGLSRREAADSESVEELLEEGNAFEAEAVMGVEDADNADEKEVRTHELPEDDVPGEYLDKD
jgi:hypothetical protein